MGGCFFFLFFIELGKEIAGGRVLNAASLPCRFGSGGSDFFPPAGALG